MAAPLPAAKVPEPFPATLHTTLIRSAIHVGGSFDINVNPESVLSRCLDAALELLVDGRAQSDSSCMDFLTDTMEVCFTKLLTSSAVSGWEETVQRNIRTLTLQAMEVAAASLAHGICAPMNTVAIAFDSESVYNRLNSQHAAEKIMEQPFAQPRSTKVARYGWLLDFVNTFGFFDGFKHMLQQVSSKEKGAVGILMLAQFIKPLSGCIELLTSLTITTYVIPIASRSVEYVQALQGELLKAETTHIAQHSCLRVIMSALQIFGRYDFAARLSVPLDVQYLSALHLSTLLKILKGDSFNGVMHALNELHDIIHQVNAVQRRRNRNNGVPPGAPVNDGTISGDVLVRWLLDNDVLGVLFGDHLHHTQYVHKLEEVVKFMIPRGVLSLAHLTSMWQAQVDKHETISNNIHDLLAKLACELDTEQLDHLFRCFQSSWGGSVRNMERLLDFIRRLGEEDSEGNVAPKVLDVLWNIAHTGGVPSEIVHAARSSHVDILAYSYIKDKQTLREGWIKACLDDINNDVLVVSATKHLRGILRKYAYDSDMKSVRSITPLALERLDSSFKIRELMVCSVERYMAAARAKLKALRDANDHAAVAGFSTVHVDTDHPHTKALLARLRFLKVVVCDTRLPLNFAAAHRVWVALTAKPCCPEDVEVCYAWFTLADVPFLDNDAAVQMYTKEVLLLDAATCTDAAFRCFESFFRTTNGASRKIDVLHTGFCVYDLNLQGKGVLLDIAFRCPENSIAMKAIDMVKRIYTSLSDSLRTRQVVCNGQLLEVAIDHMQRAHHVLQGASQGGGTGSPERVSAALEIQRSLTLLTEFVTQCDSTYPRQRCDPPHGQSFVGDQLCLHVSLLGNRGNNAMGLSRGTIVTDTLTLHVHGNETIRGFLGKLGNLLRVPMDRLHVVANGAPLVSEDHNLRLTDLSIDDESTLTVRVHVDDGMYDGTGTLGSAHAALEARLPGKCLAMQPAVMDLLFAVGSECGAATAGATASGFDHHRVVIVHKVSELLTLLPTATNELARVTTAMCTGGAAAVDALKSIFSHTSIVHLVYALEVLCRILFPVLPTTVPSAAVGGSGNGSGAPSTDGGGAGDGAAIREAFIASGGVRYLCLCVQQQQGRILQQRTVRDIEYCRASVRLCLRMLSLILSNGYRPDRASAASGVFPGVPPNPLLPSPPGDNPDAAGPAPAAAPAAFSKEDEQKERETRCRALVEPSILTGVLSCMSCLVYVAAMGKIQPTEARGDGTMDADGDAVMPASDVTIAHVLSDDRKLATEALDILYSFLVAFPKIRNQFLKGDYGWPQLQTVLLGSADAVVRQQICTKFSALAQTDGATLALLFGHAMEARRHVDTNAATCMQFFTFLCALYQLDHTTLSGATGEAGGGANHLAEEVDWLCARCDGHERIATDLELLAGHLKLCAMLVSLNPAARFPSRQRLLPGLVRNILFPASTKLALVQHSRDREGTATGDHGAVATNDVTMGAQSGVVASEPAVLTFPITDSVRRAAFAMVVELCAGSMEGVHAIQQHLQAIHFREDAITSEFDHEPSISDRGVSGYVGLKNAGATCYMNSVLQQMYMQPQIRCGLLNGGNNVVAPDDRASSVLYQLQKITAHLNQSKMQCYAPEGFWQAYRHDGEPVNMREQQDCHDFFTGVIDQIDEKLSASGRPKLFESIYGGLFADQKKITKGCEHQYEREESFMTLQLDVRNFGSLDESLQQYVKGDLLEGANAYHCEKCGEKRDAIKRTCLKRLPTVLVIHLKRFEFDWERDVAVKYNGLFEFPKEIDMGPYTVEGLDAKESAGKPGAKPAPVYKYKLVGVTVHSGQANGGHYYSFIRSRCDASKWYRFDDAEVTECVVDESFMAKELFGGMYVTDVWDPTGRRYVQRSKERWWNGYLLFYERVEADAAGDAMAIDASDSARSAATSPSHSPVPSPGAAETPVDDPSIVLDVQDQNRQFNHRKEIFNREYFAFMFTLCMNTVNAVKEQHVAAADAERVLHTTTNMACNIFIHYVLRLDVSVRGPVECWLELFTVLFDLFPSAAALVLVRLDNADLNYQLFYQCSNEQVRQIFLTLLMHTIRVMRRSTAHTDADATPTIEKYFTDNIIPLVDKADMFSWWKNMNTLFQVCTQYARMDPRNRQFLHQMQLTERCVNIMATLIRGNVRSLTLPQGRALCEFTSTMLRCVALPTYNEYTATGLANVTHALATTNPYFEDSGAVDDTVAGDEDIAVKVLMPTPEIMEGLSKCRYFAAGIHAPISGTFKMLLLYLSFRDLDVGSIYLNQLLQMTCYADPNPPVNDCLKGYFSLLKDLVAQPHPQVTSTVLNNRIQSVFVATHQSFTYFDLLEGSIVPKALPALKQIAQIAESNPNVQQFLKDPANIPQLSAALRGLGRAVSSHGHPNRESLLAVQSRLLALIPQLATGNRMLDDSGRRSSDDSGSDSDIGHDGDGMA